MLEATTETAKTQTEAASSTETASTETTSATLLGSEEGKQEQAAGETQTEKTEATTTEEKTETKTEEQKAEGAPEKYEFANADKYDATVLGSFSEAAKLANLTQDAAQKLLDSMAPKLVERQVEQVKAVHQQWVEASRADKEFGGDKLTENLGIAKKGYEMLTTPEDRAFLEQSGLGNHPAIIRMAYRAGKAISEDKFVGGSPSTVEADPAKRLFPNQA